ncbi:hypothetical protein O0I10_006180 [Lichtheimia ornata]|uniref:F-box domain-containing protein n=1 Tax=Lichtheimia ornata TaxID=688661 RepID=A0AAD7V2J0_9FUNG|nr:uncharacterized protein O0I10_006180 [Lichtheimia ornata]KAJ8658173.1 hypothetical protein O0I10_006180 [Lichtheimia ornata]
MAENASLITRLPPEILALIFANLSLQHRVQCLCICRSWRAFLFSWSGLWNELSDNEGYDMIKMFKAYMQSSSSGTPMRYRIDSIHIHATRRRKHKQIMRLFKEYQSHCRIQSVHLYGNMSRHWFRRMIRLEDMVRLTLNGVSNPAPDKVFAIVLHECPNLKHFVYHTAWSAHAPASPSSSFNWSFPPHHKLLSLDMYLHARVDSFPLHRLLSSLPHLVAIRLNPYDFDGAAHVLHMLQQHPFLQAIRFNYHDNDVDEEQQLRGKRGGGGGLRQLQIQELCGIDDTALIPFLIQHHTTLRILDIHFVEYLTHLTASALASLSFSVLERISLSNLVGAHPSHLMAFFARATRLRQVRIFALDAFNDNVLYTLGQYASRLESLYLAHCENITPKGLLQFATTAKCKSTTLALCQVDHDMMDNTSTSYDNDNVLDAIRQALPQLVSM